VTTTSSLRQRRSVLVGLVGAGIQASRTPRLHEREGAEHGLTYIYKVIDLDALGLTVDALPEIMTAAERLGFDGLNITYPCKRAVLDLLDELSSDARAIGAVNTVIFKNSRRFGHNTDWSGFAESFRRSLPDVSRERIVQLGAGGAGAAVAHALLTLAPANFPLSTRSASGRRLWLRRYGRATAPSELGQLRMSRSQFPVPMVSSTQHRSVWANFRVCLSSRACLGPGTGWLTWCIFHWKRSCCVRRKCAAAVPCQAPAWPCSRPQKRFVSSAGKSRTRNACFCISRICNSKPVRSCPRDMTVECSKIPALGIIRQRRV